MDENQFSLYELFQHIKDNIVGFMLLLLSIFIIYIVDYITHINSLTYSIATSVPNALQPVNLQPVNLKPIQIENHIKRKYKSLKSKKY
jgi:hypothetical protein